MKELTVQTNFFATHMYNISFSFDWIKVSRTMHILGEPGPECQGERKFPHLSLCLDAPAILSTPVIVRCQGRVRLLLACSFRLTILQIAELLEWRGLAPF